MPAEQPAGRVRVVSNLSEVEKKRHEETKSKTERDTLGVLRANPAPHLQAAAGGLLASWRHSSQTSLCAPRGSPGATGEQVFPQPPLLRTNDTQGRAQPCHSLERT